MKTQIKKSIGAQVAFHILRVPHRLLVLAAFVLYLFPALAQSPQKMSYQAIIRNTNNTLVANTPVGVKISIIHDSINGSVVFEEIFNPNPVTNINGLLTIEIGTGIPIIGSFSGINWANGSYFIKIDSDPTGGTNYSITSTSQLLSVPYAFHSKTADALIGGITETDPVFTAWDKDYADLINTPTIPTVPTNVSAFTNDVGFLTTFTETDPIFTAWNKDYNDLINKPITDGSETKLVAGSNVTIIGNGTIANPYVINSEPPANKFYIGQDTLGGIVFHIYLDANGDQRGFIVSKTEATLQWQNTTSQTSANRSEDGVYNTNLMTNSPAKNWVTSLGADWYLPSVDELTLLWQNRYHVNRTARAIGSTLVNPLSSYWSSLEGNPTHAYNFNFSETTLVLVSKTNNGRVRAVRAF